MDVNDNLEVYPSVIAMKIVGLDRLKFNEAVSNGHYVCAPATRVGQQREFNFSDLTGLYVFARLIEGGFTVRTASKIACAVVVEARKRPTPEAVRFNVGTLASYETSPVGLMIDLREVRKRIDAQTIDMQGDPEWAATIVPDRS